MRSILQSVFAMSKASCIQHQVLSGLLYSSLTAGVSVSQQHVYAAHQMHYTAEFEEVQQSRELSSAVPQVQQPKAKKSKKGKKGAKQKPAEESEAVGSSLSIDPRRGLNTASQCTELMNALACSAEMLRTSVAPCCTLPII